MRSDGVSVVHDRLGSVVARSGCSDCSAYSTKEYFPYGDEISGNTAGNVDKFGTYMRDATTGLDYADQRYFAGTMGGRFLTADPYQASGGAAAPGSWNRYPYVGGDPVNRGDPTGLFEVDYSNGCGAPGTEFCADDGYTTWGGGEPGGVCLLPGLGNPFFGPTVTALCGIVFAPVPPPPPPKTCKSDFTGSQIAFVQAHYADAANLADQADLPTEVVLGWSALESGWGKPINTAYGNYFGWKGRGNYRCPEYNFACFKFYYSSAYTALFSSRDYFTYDNVVGVSVVQILSDQFNNGASVQTVFDTLAKAGWTPDKGYGRAVASTVSATGSIIDCLKSLGELR